MKKILLVLTLVLAFLLSSCNPETTSFFYSEIVEKDGFHIAINKIANCAFVSKYDCTEYVENQEITIPDYYEKYPIVNLGGYFGRGLPSPFRIDLRSLYMNAPQGSKYYATYTGDISKYNITEPYDIKELVVTLNIGKNIKRLEYVESDFHYPHINDDGSITFYYVAVYINCSEENEYFYSKDGKLYDKNTNELISDFIYAQK